jgi:hypothetical protein
VPMDEASTPVPRPVFCWHGLANVVHKGATDAVYCRKCDKEWGNAGDYYLDVATLNEQYQAHLLRHSVWREGAEL